jgi:predicted PurR-regulated permease PerM
MINLLSKSPFYLRAAIILIGIYLFVNILYIGQEIFIPITFSAIFSILLSPAVNFLEKKKFGKVLSILIPLTVAILVTLCISGALLSEAGLFSKALPRLENKIHSLLSEGIPWLSGRFNISEEAINKTILNVKNDVFNKSSQLIGQVLSLLTNAFLLSILIPIYIFMMLFYKPLMLEFIRQFFDVKDHARVGEIIMETKFIIKNYLIGLLIETAFIAVIYTVSLWLFGLKYVLLLGVIGAIINVIPYIGGIISVIFYVLLTFIVKDSLSYSLLVLLVYTVIQFIDKHYIIPVLVASKVNVNALLSVIMIIVGGALWGFSGMFLSIPFTGIMKVIFDRVDILKPWGVLLGDTMPDHVKFKLVPKERAIKKHK